MVVVWSIGRRNDFFAGESPLREVASQKEFTLGAIRTWWICAGFAGRSLYRRSFRPAPMTVRSHFAAAPSAGVGLQQRNRT